MELTFNGLNIPFSLEGVSFHAHSLSLDAFSVPLPGHRHGSGCYEIHYVTSGMGTLKLEGDTFSITPNTLYVTGPKIYHEQIPNLQNPMREYCIYLQTEQFRTRNAFLQKFLDTRKWFGQDTQGLLHLFETMFLELNRKPPCYLAKVSALLSQLVIHLIRNYEFRWENAVPEVSPPSPDSMSLIAEKCFLFEYASITLQELAGRLGISPRQTERFLKKEYGESFQQKKTHARMAAAASFLADPSLSITAISDRLGYSSAEHFSHAFRNYYGVSPRQYRKDAALF